jgi:hypothetical protein
MTQTYLFSEIQCHVTGVLIFRKSVIHNKASEINCGMKNEGFWPWILQFLRIFPYKLRLWFFWVILSQRYTQECSYNCLTQGEREKNNKARYFIFGRAREAVTLLSRDSYISIDLMDMVQSYLSWSE